MHSSPVHLGEPATRGPGRPTTARTRYPCELDAAAPSAGKTPRRHVIVTGGVPPGAGGAVACGALLTAAPGTPVALRALPRC